MLEIQFNYLISYKDLVTQLMNLNLKQSLTQIGAVH